MVADIRAIEAFRRGRRSVVTIEPDATISVAAQKMTEHEIGCLVVVTSEGQTVGIISERDVVARVVAKGIAPADARVEDAMSRQVHAVSSTTSIEEAARRMAKSAVRHLPIVENAGMVGMVSSRDVLNHQLAIANAEIRKSRGILQDLEDEHPGITRLKTDGSGRIVI
jgi:CBS domain-containing protein